MTTPSPRMRRLTRVAIVTIALLSPMALFPQFGSATRKRGTIGTVAIPRKARLEDAPATPNYEHSTWVGWRFSRFHTFAMGSGTPYRASLFINLHAPNAGPGSYEEALNSVEGELNGGAGPGTRQVVKDATWDIIQGRYEVNALDEPTWRIKYRDPSRRVSALWQVHQKDWKLDEARAALVKIVESVKRTGEADFGEITDRPRKAAEENERKFKAALALLADKGYAPLTPGKVITKDGVTVEYLAEPERRLALYKTVAAKPARASLPAWVSTGTRTWTGSAWEDEMDNNDYYPSPATRALLDRTLAKPGPHHFIVRTIRLDELEEKDFHIADFLTYAATVK